MLPVLGRFILAIGFVFVLGAPVRAFDSAADYAFVMDAETGLVLYEKNADAPMSPASMSKLMTVLMVFEALRDDAVQPDTKFFVSDDAWRRGGSASGGSTMFLNARSKVSVLDLLEKIRLTLMETGQETGHITTGIKTEKLLDLQHLMEPELVMEILLVLLLT